MEDDVLPLGYRTSPELLRKYACRHGLQWAKTSVYQGETTEDEAVDEAYIVFVALERAGAELVDWVASADSDGKNAMYLQISGGGNSKSKSKSEWRIAEDVEKKMCNEFELTEKPVRFRPVNWVSPNSPKIDGDRISA
jgi:hypothetical protein